MLLLSRRRATRHLNNLTVRTTSVPHECGYRQSKGQRCGKVTLTRTAVARRAGASLGSGGDGGNLPPLIIPLPEAISALPRVWKPIDGFPELPAAQHQVALGRLQRAVPEQLLDRPQVGAVA